MPPQGRVGDKAQAPPHPHGCPACPHPATGPAIQGSPNVLVNDLPALRLNDPGTAVSCCGPNMWMAASGSATVLINNLPAHRLGDQTRHCGFAPGFLIAGSPDVTVGG